MKKVININFQGRIIPIEESAYEELQKYTESLRRYFAREEGRDEIINDIENRIAELFSERIKANPAGCVTDADVDAVAKSIGRPEDFDAVDDEKETTGTGTSSSQQSATAAEPRGSLFRNESDKILGGVCSGLAHYLRIDPTIVRILFAIITFGGFGTGFLLYIILWVVLPARGMKHNVRRRLYRNRDDKVIGGVCSGIASYFNIAVWIPRVIFSIPFFISIINGIFNNTWGDFDPFPNIVFGSFGGTLIVTYIILWIVVPFASTASEKLEMRGEKVDLESIKNSVQEELQSVKGRSANMAETIKDRAMNWGEEVKERGKAFASEAAPAVRNAGSGIGHAIGVLFKAFFLFVAGIIVFVLFLLLMAMIFSGIGVFPLKNFLLDGFWQNTMAWGTLVFFLGVPVLAAVVWLIRRISGAKSKNNYIGYVFGSLWTIGWICMIVFVSMVTRQFKRTGNVREDITLVQPSKAKLVINVNREAPGKYYGFNWFNDHDNDEFPALSADEDSMLLNTVRVRIVKSSDSNYHAYTVKFARGNSPVTAEETASKVRFPTTQNDTVVSLSKGFAISKDSKFRNQQVLFVVEVPVGKRVMIDRSTDWYSWFSINTNRRGVNVDWDIDWDNGYNWRSNIWYVMTDNGIERVDRKDKDSGDEDESRGMDENGEFRYRKNRDTIDIKIDKKDTTVNIKLRTELEKKESEAKAQAMNESSRKEGEESPSYRQPMISVLDILKLDSR